MISLRTQILIIDVHKPEWAVFRSEDTVKDAERGASRAPRSWLCSLTAFRAEAIGRWPEFRVEAHSSSKLEKNLFYMAVVEFSAGLPWFRSWLSGAFSARVPIPARFVAVGLALDDE